MRIIYQCVPIRLAKWVIRGPREGICRFYARNTGTCFCVRGIGLAGFIPAQSKRAEKKLAYWERLPIMRPYGVGFPSQAWEIRLIVLLV